MGTETKSSGLNVTLEGLLVIAPVPGIGFAVGPYAGIPLSGTAEADVTNAGAVPFHSEGDLTITALGVTSVPGRLVLTFLLDRR